MIDLLAWLRHPRADAGIDFIVRGHAEHWGYPELAQQVTREAERLRDAGVTPGSTVCLAVPATPGFVAAFYAALVVGAVPCPLQLAPTQTRAMRSEALVGLLSVASPRAIYVDARTREVVAEALRTAGGGEAELLVPRAAMGQKDLPATDPVADVPRESQPADVGLMQFTSGATGQPRAVELTVANLTNNISGIRSWLEMGDNDIVSTWVPPFHDMGLVGCLLTPITGQNGVVVMQPGDFIRDPLGWLRHTAGSGGTIGVAPPFALRLVLRQLLDGRGKDPTRADLDLTNLRALLLGAERIDWSELTQFSRSLRTFGFDAAALTPAYGLAEATLAVTGTPIGQVPTAARVHPTTMAIGAPVDINGVDDVIGTDIDTTSTWITSCGPPLDATTVDIVHEGKPLPPGHLGLVRVNSPSVAARYRTSADSTSAARTGDGLLTGDLGFLHRGQLHVVARAAEWVAGGDGRGISPDTLEGLLRNLDGSTDPGQYVCLTRQDPPELVLVAEDPDPAWLSNALETLRELAPDDTEVAAWAVGAGWIERTTSGKARRAPMAQRIADLLPSET